MVSSPKDQKQGDSTEKQADPISIYNQLDHRHKQKSAYQEHNAIHSASSRSIVSHVDVQHPSGRLDQGVLILTLPLNLSHIWPSATPSMVSPSSMGLSCSRI